MAEKLVFSAEAIILCVTALIFSADKDAFTKDVDLAPELAKPGAITFEGYATLVIAFVIALWVCVTKRFSEAMTLKVMILKKREAEMALDSDEAPQIVVAPAPTSTTSFNLESITTLVAIKIRFWNKAANMLHPLRVVMEKLSQSFASSSCHRVIGDILMGKQCATTIVGEINASRDTNAALMAEKLVFSAEAIILCVTALIFSADKDAFTKEVDLAPELAKPGAITFEGYATLVNAYVMALWVCVTKRFSDAVILKVIILKKREAEMALDNDEAPTATTGSLVSDTFIKLNLWSQALWSLTLPSSISRIEALSPTQTHLPALSLVPSPSFPKFSYCFVMEKLSQSFASSSCHRVIGDIPMGKQCATTIVGEINASRDIVMLILNVVVFSKYVSKMKSS
ncbi:hypothetical protein Bca101_080433 [Brassica carinata]